VTAVTKSASISLRSPATISSSPIGERQSVGGRMSLVSLIALNSASIRGARCGRRGGLGFQPARSQISSATLALTRQKSCCSAPAASARAVLEHLHQHAQLHAVRVRLDLARRRGQFRDAAIEGAPPPASGRAAPSAPAGSAAARRLLRQQRHPVVQAQVRIDDGALLEELVHRQPAADVGRLHLDRHARAVRRRGRRLVPGGGGNSGASRVSSSFRIAGLFLRVSIWTSMWCAALPRAVRERMRVACAGGELAVHARGADADALLAARHAQPVEFGAVEQLGEDARNLRADDAGPVVGHGDAEPRRRGLRRSRR
jgi:hypothetical protein